MYYSFFFVLVMVEEGDRARGGPGCVDSTTVHIPASRRIVYKNAHKKSTKPPPKHQQPKAQANQ